FHAPFIPRIVIRKVHPLGTPAQFHVTEGDGTPEKGAVSSFATAALVSQWIGGGLHSKLEERIRMKWQNHAH
ncbi:TPA: hypothetical protein ACM6V6_004834, partial [Escherichia coli]